jgi:chromate transporter
MREVFSYFIKLGALGFGGPLALIAAMQKDLVEKRRWMEPHAFARTFALIKAMPGPIAFQVAVYLGHRRAGFLGALAAAVGLLLPAFILMILLGVFEKTFEASPLWIAAMLGMQAGALGLIAASLKGLFWNHRTQPLFWCLLVIAIFPVIIFPAWEPVVIFGAGLVAVQIRKMGRPPPAAVAMAFPTFVFGDPHALVQSSMTWMQAWFELTISCFKAGAFVFGSGLAIVPMMEGDFVTRLGWLTRDQFMEALAFGQITPGPVTITATFIGFKTLGFIGALTATVAVFGAPFFHMTTWFPRVNEKLAGKKWISDFLLGAIAAVVAAVAISVIRLGMGGEFGPLHYVLMGIAFLATLSGRIPAWVLVPATGAISALAAFVV